MIRCIVAGAAGRMGRRLVANIAATEGFALAGALEYPGCPLLGEDSGTLAGIKPTGIPLTAELEPLLAAADVLIDFATGGVVEAVTLAAARNVAAVVGTTTLGDEGRQALAALAAKGARIVLAGNMSVGVNLLYKLVAEAAKILGEGYDVEIVEMHHNRKQDAPSGTAARLAEVVCEAYDRDPARDLRYGRQGVIGPRTPREIGMHSLRGGDVVGDHTVIFASEGERVELTHKASSRDTFARGALRAAEFLLNAAPGYYDMQDVLGLK